MKDYGGDCPYEVAGLCLSNSTFATVIISLRHENALNSEPQNVIF